MKKIFLIGDSIRMGYDKFVRLAYEGQAEVYYPGENCRFSEYILRNLHEWKRELKCGDDVDLVHWNVGLWDLIVLYEDGTLTPIEVYRAYLERICKRIQIIFPKAQVVFATTTPVQEELYNPPFQRYNSDIEAFNQVAIDVVTKYGHRINDFYGALKNAPQSYYSDVTHFYTREATELMVNMILKEADTSLGLEAGVIDYDKYFEKIVKETEL